ncbi:MAG: hypothetical protein QOF35_71 [Actinomycetota bacterium]|nr:hypothetical protein [Actinomycetota bacterium]
MVVERITSGSGTRWVGIDGKGASGKTTLAAQLAVAWREAHPDALCGPAVIHVDDFARPDLRGWDRDRFMAQVRDPLLAGRTARYLCWDFDTDSPVGWVEVEPGGPVIVEGVSSTDIRLAIPWDVTIWVDVPRELRLRRALARDGEVMRERWLTDWMPSEDDYEREQRPQRRVDLIVDPRNEP